MSLLVGEPLVNQPTFRVPGASRSVQPEIPSEPSAKPVDRPSTPVKRSASPKPAVAPKPGSPAPTGAPTSWTYRGVTVNLAQIAAEHALERRARSLSQTRIVYRGVEIDPAYLQEQAMLAEEARANSQAGVVYRGVAMRLSRPVSQKRRAFVGQ